MRNTTPAEFLRTVYLGDRACKSIRIGAWDREVAIEVDSISRVRDPAGVWNFYTAEDIENGLLVFTKVKSISFNPSGPLPNDDINGITATQIADSELWLFELSISSVADDASTTEVVVRIIASDVHLGDPSQSDKPIRE